MRAYCRQAAIEKTEPKKHEGYKDVSTAVKSDNLLKAEHLFWISLAQDFQSFLCIYQADKPMIPFLASYLEKFLRTLMSRFVKEDVISSAKTFNGLAKIDVAADANRKLGKEVDIGIVTRREPNELKQSGKITPREKMDFELNCRAFLTHTTAKLLEKCPLKLPMVRFLRCLDPQVMAGQVIFSVKLFERLLSCLLDAKRVCKTEVDEMREYASFVQSVQENPSAFQQFQNYDRISSERVDSFLTTLLRDSVYRKLWGLVRCLLVLSHGQAGVERGVSINSEIM